MAETRYIITMSFATREERDKYKADMLKCFDNGHGVDRKKMRSEVQSGAVTRYRIWEGGFWKEVFRPWTHRWSHTEYDR